MRRDVSPFGFVKSQKSAKDLFHPAVKQALLKEEWIITADPLIIKIEGVKFEIDLAAEKILGSEKAGRKIAVEVKSFLNSSAITDFHVALGQFLNYRLALQMKEPDRTLYLVVLLILLKRSSKNCLFTKR